MRALAAVTQETFLRLRRDKIYIPVIIAGLLMIVASLLASYWSIEEIHKMFFDLGSAGMHVAGAVVAIFWGTKAITDSRQEGSLEVQLASPISRSVWLTGKFLGLSIGLILMGITLIVFWQIAMSAYGYGVLSAKQVVILSFQILSWLVLAAVAIFFASFCSNAVALFCSLCLWIAGLASQPILQALSPTTPANMRSLVEGITRFWNLHQFNLANYAAVPEFPLAQEIWSSLGYGFFLIGVLLSLSCLIFNRRDLIA